MTSKETLKSLVQSNENLESEHNSAQIIDSNIQIELMILYLRANIDILKKLNIPDIEDIAMNSNYTISNGIIVHNNTLYYLSTLKEIVEKIHNFHETQERKIIAFPKRTTFLTEEKPSSFKIIELRQNKISFNERGEIFERTISIDSDTKPYIYNVKANYLDGLYKLIELSFTENKINIEPPQWQALSSLLRFYSFIIYQGSHKQIPYQELNIPQNEIGLRVPNNTNPEVQKANLKTQEILIKMRVVESKALQATDEQTKIKMHRMTEYYRRLALESMLNSYFIQTEPAVYNKNLITNIIESLNNGYFDINFNYLNPLVRIFNIKKGKITFMCTMHLNVFYNIVNSKVLNNNQNTEKKLEYKNE